MFHVNSSLMAIVIPNMGSFTSLMVGALCLSMLGFTFPALIEICVLDSDGYGLGSYKCCNKNVLLITFGFFATGIGMYVAILDIIESYKNNRLFIK